MLAKLGKEEDGEDNVVHRIIMNPKAMTINQMYGHFDELNEWNDGILATTYRYWGKLRDYVQKKFMQEFFQHVAQGMEMVDLRWPCEFCFKISNNCYLFNPRQNFQFQFAQVDQVDTYPQVDPEWIENLNTVLDENRKLCLMSGEIIKLPK